MARGSSSQNVRAALIVAILALLGLNIYQYYIGSALKKENTEQNAELIEIHEVKEELDKQYYETLSELEEMKGSNEELNARIETQQNELTKQKERIGLLLRDSKNLQRARSELKTLKEANESFIAQIDELKAENEELTASNQRLTDKTKQLSDEVLVKDSINISLQKSSAELQKEKDAIDAEKKKISKKFNKVSAIQVNKIDVNVYKTKDNGKATRRYWAKNVDLLKICFNTTENENADVGNEAFFVRIIDPKGEVLAFDTEGSGVMESTDDGKKIMYSYDLLIDYQKDKQSICKQWRANEALSSGTYKIEVYNHGYLVGEDNFKLL